MLKIIDTIPIDKGYVSLIKEGITSSEISAISGLSHSSTAGPGFSSLISWDHLSPLEFSFWIFKIKAPICVFRHLERHRTGKFMEKSYRYSPVKDEFYYPSSDPDLVEYYRRAYEVSYRYYNMLIKAGEHKEKARMVLGPGVYTEAFVGFDLRNLRNLLKLRMSPASQKVTQDFAKGIFSLLPEDLLEGLDE